MKKVYLAMSTDIIHHGHMNIIEKARELGEVTVGILADEVVASYKRFPLLSFDERKKIIENIKGVNKVVKQKELDYVNILKTIKPDYVVHGDDWKKGPQKSIRERVIKTLAEWDGQLVEIEYTEGESIEQLDDKIDELGTTPNQRRKKLRRLIEMKPIVKILEAHNGLTSLIAEKTKVVENGEIASFDGMWISSLCDSTVKGKPDIELVDLTSRINTINEILEVTTKPIILDGDTGGKIEHFTFTVKSLERIGVSAVIIEDKIGLKKNSLFGTEVQQEQDSIEHFCEKIVAGKKAQVTDDFMIIARIESLILKAGLEDALKRAKAYIEAGADAIMIHSKIDTPVEILEFCEEYKKFDHKIPLVAVPSSYCQITEDELIEAGINVVIYANQLIRSAYPAMKNTAESILRNNRAKEADEDYCMPIKEILTLIPGGK
ncbi:phosphoenolpyruvate mutase [Halanaerobium hydrogeniformans]|uniref:phosphoenolpyruvate mutase n=1 Tax=Halanaerobium hydrogeniformans TaxID=656519 RepID=E4RNK3_HALHG|nr:phosphoenolpyruvate mutase [Halanaerobium hydrogeniformans]ADQ13538.1 phosphoenolpyruvate phosphomutase [Halanaerobium hydrogeniformans]